MKFKKTQENILIKTVWKLFGGTVPIADLIESKLLNSLKLAGAVMRIKFSDLLSFLKRP